jgi:hypothetical protein
MSETEATDQKVENTATEDDQVTDTNAVQVVVGLSNKDVTAESVENELVEEAIKFINETVRETFYKGYLEIGKYLFVKFYDSDIERVRSKNPKKKASLRKLKSHHGLPVHPSTLHDMVRVVAQEHFFSEHDVDSSQLTYTHKCELVKLPDDDNKIDLVQRIINESMSTRQLTHVITDKRKELTKSKTGKPEMISAPTQLIKDLKGLFDPKISKQLFINPDELKTLQPEQRNDLKGKIGETLAKLQEVTRIFKKCLQEIKTIETEEKRKE